MRNVQQRSIDAPTDRLGALLDRVSTADDPLWPTASWPPLVLDAGLTPGSRGGHGPIRYRIAGQCSGLQAGGEGPRGSAR